MRAEWREDIIRLHQKIDEVHTQTTKTNGRVTELEKKHETCPGRTALDKQNKDSLKESKEWQMGNIMLIGAACLVAGMVIYNFTKSLL
jgi:hypothetical protein